MGNENYIVVTIKPWNIKTYNEVIRHYTGNWHLITEREELTVDFIKSVNPKYIFFPHWSDVVSSEILDLAICICFHETDLPYGRGGSPLQNLIEHGERGTMISAIKMTTDIDAGPIYLKKSLSLEGLAEEIFIRAAHTVAEMIRVIITENLKPEAQVGKAVFFKRRKPSQSRIPSNKNNLVDIFDHIRMLDAETYPKAFVEIDGFRYEISRPALRTGSIFADVSITKIEEESND